MDCLQHHVVAQMFSMPGWGELLIVAFIGLLLFGKRLPDVGRSLGRSIIEFKKGISGIEDQINEASNRPSSTPTLPPVDTTSSVETPPVQSEEKIEAPTRHSD